MASDKTLALKLTGDEIKKAILDKLDQELSRNCIFTPNLIYDWFDGNITGAFRLHELGTDFPAQAVIHASAGTEPEGEIQEAAIEIPIEKQPPNAVRVESGQEVPSLAKDGKSGKTVVKKIQYARKAAEAKAK